ncbi:hypothetical protein [Nonomuraea angiospora]
MNTAAELGQADESAAQLVRRMFDRTEAAFRALVKEAGERARSPPTGTPGRPGACCCTPPSACACRRASPTARTASPR